MQLHLVDATYELFRAYYAPRPPVLGREGQNLSGVSGLAEQLLFLLREQGATHVGCATDRVIESFRNDLYPGYKSSAGMPRDLLAQFPLAEGAIEALGITLWPMVEWEADDALAAATARFHGAPGVERILICSVDKDLAQCVRGTAVVLWDRRRDLVYDEDGVKGKWGVAPESIPDYLALVGDSSDGYPGIPGFGAKTAAALLARWGHLEQVPVKGSAWDLAGVRNAVPLAQVLVERLGEAMLYRDLARLRTAEDGVPIPERSAADLAWAGANRAAWEAFCDELGLDRLKNRPHRWAAA
jgi:5'-3' exonuclease